MQTSDPGPRAEIFPELTEDVIGRMGGAQDVRLREVMTCLVRHVHAFVREAGITHEEWALAVAFLTDTGKICSGDRQEFILLSDILGISMLVDAVNHQAGPGVADSTVLGPFYAGPQREVAAGESILLREEPDAEPLRAMGRVTDPEGGPIPDALLEVWQTAPNELYDVQDPDQPEGHLRASLRSDGAGGYDFSTIVPTSYPIPDDGPVGKLLRRLGRHPYRPAHIHFIISAPGFRTLTTHLFTRGNPYLESDAVFGVKPSLIVEPVLINGRLTIEYDFGLARL